MNVFQENALYKRLAKVSETLDTKGFLLTPHLEMPVELEVPLPPRKWTRREAGGINLSHTHRSYGYAVVTELNIGVNPDALLPATTFRFQTLEELRKTYIGHTCKLQSDGREYPLLNMALLEALVDSYQQDGYVGYCGYFGRYKRGISGWSLNITLRNADNTGLVYLQVESR